MERYGVIYLSENELWDNGACREGRDAFVAAMRHSNLDSGGLLACSEIAKFIAESDRYWSSLWNTYGAWLAEHMPREHDSIHKEVVRLMSESEAAYVCDDAYDKSDRQDAADAQMYADKQTPYNRQYARYHRQSFTAKQRESHRIELRIAALNTQIGALTEARDALIRASAAMN